ncbi:glycosyltransferase [Nocardioides bruguierae]|uniref:glycosyltransferase n=1 Tax=Nocardioides bruguierae TaxID=2945102 RepID=UPI0020226F7A|nr:glycosyltransferase [Nocardioides bruguierae]MCL8024957.1 glycosyltransferase [Nocardioides bruguierae]
MAPSPEEAEGLRDLLPRVVGEVGTADPHGRVLVVDDGARPEVAAAVGALMLDLPSLELVMPRSCVGTSAALRVGIAHALRGGATRVVVLDPDGRDDPTDLEHLLEALDAGHDLVTGVRGRARSGFRAMRAEVAADVAPLLHGEVHRHLGVVALGLGHRVTEVPVHRPLRRPPRRPHRGSTGGGSGGGSGRAPGAREASALLRRWRSLVDLLTLRLLLDGPGRGPARAVATGGAVAALLGAVLLLLLALPPAVTGGPGAGGGALLGAALLLVLGVQVAGFGLLAELVAHARRLGQLGRGRA